MTDAGERLEIAAADGYRLAGHLFAAKSPIAAILINGAVAAPQRIYWPLSRRLRDEGFSVLTYDYRGVGLSRPTSLHGFPANLHDWGVRDMPGAISDMKARYPNLPLLGIGHSFGGQALGLQNDPNIFSRYAAVATLSGYWRNTDEPYKVLAQMNLLGVPATYLFGYLPGNLSGFGEDLPAKVFRQWAHWCRQPNYLFDDPTVPERENFAKYTGDYLAIGLKDDPWGTPKALRALTCHYANARLQEQWIDPAQSPRGAIGHFGYFRPENGDALWPGLIDWLKAK